MGTEWRGRECHNVSRIINQGLAKAFSLKIGIVHILTDILQFVNVSKIINPLRRRSERYGIYLTPGTKY